MTARVTQRHGLADTALSGHRPGSMTAQTCPHPRNRSTLSIYLYIFVFLRPCPRPSSRSPRPQARPRLRRAGGTSGGACASPPPAEPGAASLLLLPFPASSPPPLPGEGTRAAGARLAPAAMQITLKTLQQQTFRIDIDPEETVRPLPGSLPTLPPRPRHPRDAAVERGMRGSVRSPPGKGRDGPLRWRWLELQ